MTSYIRDLTELTGVANNDYLLISDTSDVTNTDKRISQLNLVGATLTGGGTIATGGFTLTAPATGTVALRSGAGVLNNLASWADANSVKDGGFATSDIARLSVSNTFSQGLNVPAHTGIQAAAISINNNTAVNWNDPNLVGCYLLQTNLSNGFGFAQFRALAGGFVNIFQPAAVFVGSTAVLSGTTGAAGKVTISANATPANGTVYVENQSGSTLSIIVLRVG